ncbi:MAG: cobalamin-dependent protein, partial [Planctomycetota bacterium]
MKVLVVNSNTELLPYPVVPLGACLTASAARDRGFDVSFLDLAFEKDPALAVIRALDRTAPDAVGVSIRNIDNTCYTSPRQYLPAVREKVVGPILERLPDRVVLGGAGFSTMPEEILAFTGAPAGVVGDGEKTFPEILERWRDGKSLEGLPGIV